MLPIAHYGHFIGMNNSDSKVYEVGTGADNIRNYGRINKWNNWSDLKEPDPPVWRSDYANQISGTDGGAFSPLLSEQLITLHHRAAIELTKNPRPSKFNLVPPRSQKNLNKIDPNLIFRQK